MAKTVKGDGIKTKRPFQIQANTSSDNTSTMNILPKTTPPLLVKPPLKLSLSLNAIDDSTGDCSHEALDVQSSGSAGEKKRTTNKLQSNRFFSSSFILLLLSKK